MIYIYICIYIGGREARSVGESGLGAAGAHLLYWYRSACLLVQKYRYWHLRRSVPQECVPGAAGGAQNAVAGTNILPKRCCRHKSTTKTLLQVQKYYQNAVAGTLIVLLHQYARAVVTVSCFDKAGGALKRCCRQTQEKILSWLALLVQKYECWRRRRPGRRSRRRYHARTRRAASCSSPIFQRPRQKEKKLAKNKKQKIVRQPHPLHPRHFSD